MNVLVSSHVRFSQTPDGALWSPSPSSAYGFWTRYLARFSGVTICARAEQVASPPAGWTEATGPNVRAFALPSYVGPSQFARRYLPLLLTARRAVRDAEAIILRAPSDVAGVLLDRLPRRRPYGLEVIGDPLESLGATSVRHPLRPVLRWRAYAQLRAQAAKAVAVAYVSRTVLPQRYPAAPGAHSTHYSSINLPASEFAASPRSADFFAAAPAVLACIGSFEQMYKGQDLLLRATKDLTTRGRSVRVVFAGSGKHLGEMQALAKELGVDAQVEFAGHLADRQRVLALFDRAQLLVLPSRTEGLPRVVIEAQARGLPCIGARVGGVPELLDAPNLFPPDDVPALTACIEAQLSSPEGLARESAAGLTRARDYEETVLAARRTALYAHVEAETRRWQASGGRA